MKFPIDQVRKDTPGCQDKLFFNSAGSSLISKQVLAVSIEYMTEEAHEGGYDLMTERGRDFQEFYKESAKLIGAKPANMAFCTSATDAYAKVIYSFDWTSDDVILTTKDDYVSNLLTFINIKNRYGTTLEFVETLSSGDLDLDDLRTKLETLKPKLFAMTHMPTSSGIIYDAAELGRICNESDTFFLLDACQTVGQIDVNINDLHCDFLSVTGRKFLRGPRGTGFLYVSDKVLETDMVPLSLDLAGNEWTTEESFSVGSEAKRFEFWERNYSNLLGLTQSIKEINELGINNISQYNQDISSYMREKLNAINGIKQFDRGANIGSIVTWKHEQKSLLEHQQILASNRIYYSLASTRSALIDLNSKEEEWLIRFSPHYFNTREEVDQMYKILANWT